MEMIDYFFVVIGFISCLMFAFCNAPQVHKTYSDKNANGLSSAFLIMQLLGNIFNFLYVEYIYFKNNVCQYPMFFNYSIALLLIMILISLKSHYEKNT